MAQLDNYRTERNAYLILWGIGFLLAAIELRADWARYRLKRSLNRHHVRQHLMQILCAILGIIENMDAHVALGVFTNIWQVNLLGSLGGAIVVSIIQISTYLMTRGHYALIQENPRWLIPVFLGSAILFSILHVVLGSLVQLDLTIRRLDALVLVCWLLAQIVLIDIGFCRIRTVVLHSDKSSASRTKMLPQYLKIGRIVACLNLVVLFLAFWVFYSIAVITSATENTATFSVRGLIRVFGLYCTLWWSFHAPFPRQKTRASRGTTASSLLSPPSRSGNKAYAPCASSSAIPDVETDASQPAHSTSTAPGSSSSLDSTNSASYATADPGSSTSTSSSSSPPSAAPDPSRDAVIEITSQS